MDHHPIVNWRLGWERGNPSAMPPSSDPRNLRAKWQRALEERRKNAANNASSSEGGEASKEAPLDVTPRPETRRAAWNVARRAGAPAVEKASATAPEKANATPEKANATTPEKASATSPEKASATAAEKAGSLAPEKKGPALTVEPPNTPPSSEASGPSEGATSAAKEKALSGSKSIWGSVGAALILVGGVGLSLRMFISADAPSESPSERDAETLWSGSTTESAGVTQSGGVNLTTVSAVPSDRCKASAMEPFVVGELRPKTPKTPSAGDEDPEEDELSPFAVELGRGVLFGGGFAVGAQREAEGGTVSMIATLGATGENGKLVRLARSRGDFDPPVVAAAGSTLIAAMMEPNAGGRAIRIAKVVGEQVTWGPELSENNDESFAVDIRASGSNALVVWDDVPLGRERSVIEIAAFDIESMRGSGGRAITPPSMDADTPRLAPRPGGFWLSYLVHGVAKTAPTAEGQDEGEESDSKPKPGKKRVRNDDDSDTEAAGEAIAHQWIEVLPINEKGAPAGAARPVTPKDSRVIGYDIEAGEDGRAILIYREDDTPSGSHGGRVKVTTIELGGIGEAQVIAEEGVGAGVPQLLSGWVAIHSLTGPVQIGSLGPRGNVIRELLPEKSLKQGEVLAGAADRLLIATPAGRAMKLSVAQCSSQ